MKIRILEKVSKKLMVINKLDQKKVKGGYPLSQQITNSDGGG